MKAIDKILFISILLIIGLHVWGAVAPAHMNWGVHFFSFYDPVIGLGALCLVAALMIPAMQSRIVALKEKALSFASAIPVPILVLLISVLLMLLGNYFSAKLHLLGDGVLLIRSLSSTEWGPNIMQSFNNQPLMYWLFRSALNFHLIDSPASTYDLYIWINRCSLVVMVILLFWFLRQLKAQLFAKVLLGALLFSAAGCQFFFGYIENYVLQYVCTGIFVVGGWMAIERRASILLPVLTIIVMCGLHMGNLIFLPSLLMLLLVYYPNSKGRTLGVSAALGAAGLAAIYFLGYMPALIRHFSGESVDFLHPFSTPTGNFGYAMFSLYHLIDWLNLNLLIAPFGLVLATGLLIASEPGIGWKKPALVFLLSAALCGLLFTWIVNSALGMARDWDLLSGFLIPLVVLDVYLVANSDLGGRSRYILVLIATCAFLHSAAWIGVNADETRHLARMRLLNDPRLLSPTTLLFYDEALANFFFDNGRYAEAKIYYEHSLGIDPDNPRIVGNISDVYRKLGEKEKYFRTLLHAVAINSTDPGIFSNLGVEYAGRGDTNRAIEFNERAIALDPRQDKAHANLGLLYVSRKNYPLAQKHFFKAIELGLIDPTVLKYAAEISFFLNDYPDAVKYYDAYFRLIPGDKGAHVLRERAVQMMKR